MASRAERLKQLLKVQQQLTALEEMRHATLLREAAAARAEAADLAGLAYAEDSLSALFPEIYQRRIEAELALADRKASEAEVHARRAAAARAKTDAIERRHGEAAASEERAAADRLLEEIATSARQPR